MTALIDRLRAGELPAFDMDHSNIEREAYAASIDIYNATDSTLELRQVLALILAEHALQEKCIEMQDYQIRGQTARPWARAMNEARKHL